VGPGDGAMACIYAEGIDGLSRRDRYIYQFLHWDFSCKVLLEQ
jgi:hypothetical protein